jgi:4-amino-4-deoxy-L-arabinose transferase-like glycosyltransferase
MVMILKKKYFLLALVIILAFFLRIYKITEVPGGFFCDEAAIGYNAYKLLTTGKDEYGQPWPVFFRSFGDYRTPIPIYSNILLVAVFGLKEFAVRLTTVLFGVGTVFLVFLIGRSLAKFKVGLLSSFFLAISLWHIHMSRWGSEYASMPFYFSLGFWLFLVSFSRPKILLLSFIVFGLGLYTYYPVWVVIPSFVAGLSVFWIVYWARKKKLINIKYLIMGFILLLILSVPLIYGITNKYALSRWDPSKLSYFTFLKQPEIFGKYYFDHFSKQFLADSGDVGYPGHFITRHSLRDRGQLYLFDLPLIFLGLIIALFLGGTWLLVVLVLLIYPLGSALSMAGPLATRSIIGLVSFALFFGLGLKWLFSYKKRNLVFSILIAVTVILVSLSVGDYLKQYFIEYPKYSSDFWGWQYGSRDIIQYYMSVEDQYDEMYIAIEANAPQIFIPFYSSDGKKGCKKCFLGGVNNLNLNKKQLIAATPGAFIKAGNLNFRIIKEFYYPNDQVAYQIVEFNK